MTIDASALRGEETVAYMPVATLAEFQLGWRPTAERLGLANVCRFATPFLDVGPQNVEEVCRELRQLLGDPEFSSVSHRVERCQRLLAFLEMLTRGEAEAVSIG